MIRDATIDDLGAMARLIRELAVYEKLSHEVEWDEAGLAESLFGPDAAARTLVACDDGTGDVVGIAIWYRTYSTFQGRSGIWLEDLFVRPEHRGAGHGRALLEALFERATTAGSNGPCWTGTSPPSGSTNRSAHARSRGGPAIAGCAARGTAAHRADRGLPGARSDAAFLSGRCRRSLSCMSDAKLDTRNLPLAPGRWTLDPLHSSVGFTIRHLGVSKVRGHFTQFDAELVVGETLDGTSVSATVALASIDTGIGDRDDHVRSADMLDVERRPTMTFRSTAIHGDGTDWVLDGELTIGDVTRQLSLEAELGGVVAAPEELGGTRRAGFEASGQLRRKDFGLGFGTLGDSLLSDVVKIELDLQFSEPSD